MEFEVKYPLKNPEQVINKLNSIAKRDKIQEFQKDTYFELGSKVLRIREARSGDFISFKERIDGISCNNYFTKIKDVESMKRILLNSGFKEKNIIEKVRNTWFYKECEIAIDSLSDSAWFIEVEAREKKDFLAILKEICAELGVQDFKGYSEFKV